jgi:predicted DNA-binding transcriptional regulator YafY
LCHACLSMHTRSPTEIALALFAILVRERTVTQAAIARELGIGSRTVVKYLTTLCAHAVPLESQVDHPNVHWSIPRRWFPGGVTLKLSTADTLIRLLPLLAQSDVRDEVLDELHAARKGAPDPRAVVIAAPAAEGELAHLVLVEEAALARVALRIRHVGRGPLAGVLHHISPVCIVAAAPIRVIAVCHRTGALESLRLAALVEARRDPLETYRAADPVALEALLSAATLVPDSVRPANEHHTRVA